MKKISEPITFFGSGPVAAQSLRLLAQDFVIDAVITKPRAPHHRGDVPVLAAAEALAIPVRTVTDKDSLDTLFGAKPPKTRLGVLIDFGIIVSQEVIDAFPLGIINSHFSLLPEWRGADPITFSILSGQRRTGVSLMLLSAGMDEGLLLAQAPFDIPSNTTTPQLTAELIDLSFQTLHQILPLYIAGSIQPAPQEAVTLAANKTPTYSRRLTKEDSIVDWHKSAQTLEYEIRAFIEWPKTHTTLGTLQVILTQAHATKGVGPAGKLTLVGTSLAVYCGQGMLIIDRLKPRGKKEMTSQAFLAGYKDQLDLS
ncbi:MAG TPA: methionyl-tRNA formyltransferase [Nevskiaceae bacterium]|nr:methionyl-tRNA formyltransferase [Nevskiaceae bacterium]